MKERSKKAPLPEHLPMETFVRLVRVKIPNSYLPAYQAERIQVQGDRVVKRELLFTPDMPEIILGKIRLMNDPTDPQNKIQVIE